MHNAKLEKSPRLQRVLEVLTALGTVSSLQLQELAHTTAPGTCVSELRAAKYAITCKRKAGVFFYTLHGRETAA